MGTLHSQHFQTRRLCRKYRATSHSSDLDQTNVLGSGNLDHNTDLNTGHGAGHVQVLSSWTPGLHQSYAVGASNVLGRVLCSARISKLGNTLNPHLASCNVDGGYDVRSVCIESSYAASHRRSDQVLGDVQVDQGGGGSLQH